MPINHTKKTAWLAVLILFISAEIFCQQFFMDHYSLRDGLPSVSISCLEEDSHGYLWIGTFDKGISRFDGSNFQRLDYFDGSENIRNILFTAGTEQLFIATNKGLYTFNGIKIDTIHNRGVSAMERLNEDIYFISQNELFKIDETGNISAITDPQNIFSSHKIRCFKPVDNMILIGTDNGLMVLKDGDLLKTPIDNKTGIPSQPINTILPYDNRIFIGTHGNGGYYLNRENLKFSMASDYLSEMIVTDAVVFDEHALFVGTADNGLSILYPDDLSLAYEIDQPDGIKGEHINCILDSEKEVYWIGTPQGGLYKYSRRSYNYYGYEEGLTNADVSAIHSDSTTVYVANTGGTIDLIKYGVVLDDPIRFPGIDSKITTLATDKNSTLWAGTSGEGIVVSDSTGLFYLTTEGGLTGNHINKILIDDKDRVWVSSLSRGVSKIDISDGFPGHFSIKNFKKKEGLSYTRINDICLDQNQDLLIITLENYLYKIKNDTVVQLFNLNEHFPEEAITNIAVGSDSSIYFVGPGLFGKITGNKPSLILRDNDFQFHSLLEYDKNKWFVSGTYGVIQIDLTNSKNKSFSVFNPNASLDDSELIRNGIISTTDGKLWLASRYGIYSFNDFVSAKVNPTNNHNVHLTEIRINYQSILNSTYGNQADPWLTLKNGLTLRPGKYKLGFSFNAVNHAKKANYEYRWRLDGLDTQWSPWTRSTETGYSNLNGGTFRFQLQSRQGEELSQFSTGNIVIMMAFWKQPWFITLGLFSLFFLVILVVYLRFRYINRKHQKQLDQLKLKNQMISLEQKTRQLQMSPHFLNNAFNSIQALIITDKQEDARYVINEFALLMRMVLNHSKIESVPLVDEIELLKKYLTIEQFIKSGSFDFKIELPESLEDQGINIPPMILQPFVENAVKHGLKHLDQNGQILIIFESISAVKIKCRIIDNGKGLGYSPSEEVNKEHASVSTEVLRKRLDLLHGKPGQWITIENIVIDDTKIGGVEVNIILPILS